MNTKNNLTFMASLCLGGCLACTLPVQAEENCQITNESEYVQKVQLLQDTNKECGVDVGKVVEEAHQFYRGAIGCAYIRGGKNSFYRDSLRGFDVSKNIRGLLDVADKALKVNCLDISDSIYREVLKYDASLLLNDPSFTNEAQGYLDRCKIGIDDVRAEKQKPLTEPLAPSANVKKTNNTTLKHNSRKPR